MNIRKAKISDLAPLSVLFDGYRVFYKKESDLDGASSFLRERMEKGESEIFVAESAEGTLTGFVQLYPVFSSTRMQRLWLLNDLYVAPDHRGKGVSIGLIDRAKQLAKYTNACGLTLETSKSNLVGNQLYLKTGFTLATENFYFWEIGK